MDPRMGQSAGRKQGRGVVTEADAQMLRREGSLFDYLAPRLAVDRHGRVQRAPLGGDAVDAAVRMVAVRVAHVVLHVADDDVVPVGDVKSAIFAEDGIAGAEILVAAHEQTA